VRRRLPARFWIENVLALLAALVAVMTVVDAEWLEAFFGIDPDAGSGAVEWAVTVAAAGVALGTAWAAASEWRRAARAYGMRQREGAPKELGHELGR
jgi:hypothetical protein